MITMPTTALLELDGEAVRVAIGPFDLLAQIAFEGQHVLRVVLRESAKSGVHFCSLF